LTLVLRRQQSDNFASPFERYLTPSKASRLEVRVLPAEPAAEKPSRISLAIPRQGHVLTTVIEPYGLAIRTAVGLLASPTISKGATKLLLAAFVQRQPDFSSKVVRSDEELIAWALVSAWVVGVATARMPVTVSLGDAALWFWGPTIPNISKSIARNAIAQAELALHSCAEQQAYLELLPYILDPHGPGSRLSIRRDPSTLASRDRKREEGVFYTPADVADYMAGACIDSFTSKTLPSILDPACGTGVFLRAALRRLSRRHPKKSQINIVTECLFGTDIDPLVVNAAAFVLTADVIKAARGKATPPIKLWREIRSNLACVDTLRLDPAQHASMAKTLQPSRISVSTLFSRLPLGPSVVLGNPPYATLGKRNDLAVLSEKFETFSVKPNANAEIYLAFVEQAVRLANRAQSSAALVLPLSIACNIGPQFEAARQLIAKTPGHWKFAFFDREPHALFGEDVKTRNAIVIWSKTGSNTQAKIFTGPLRKWRGADRAAMFKTVNFTPIERDIRSGIPKLGGHSQGSALRALASRHAKLEEAVEGIERIRLADVPDADSRTVFVGPTAYNFLNVFLKPDSSFLQRGRDLSEHQLHAIRCRSHEDKFAVLGLLASHLAYWWWHTLGDGFHVSRRFLSEFPFGPEALLPPARAKLVASGSALWSAISSTPIISNNRGRMSLAYSPNGFDQIRRQADETLVNLASLERAFLDELQQFTARTLSAVVTNA
jgi:hypothetical protein